MERLDRVAELALRFPADGELRKWHEVCDLLTRLTSRAVKDQQRKCVSCGHSISDTRSQENADCLLCALSAMASSNSHALHLITETVERQLVSRTQFLALTFIVGPSDARRYAPSSWVREVFSELITSVTRDLEEHHLSASLASMMRRLFGLATTYPDENRLLEAYAFALPSTIQKLGPDRLSIGEALYMIDSLEASVGGRLAVNGRASEFLLPMLCNSRFAIVSAFAGQSPLSVILMYLDRAVQNFRIVSNESKANLNYAYGLAILRIIQGYEELGNGDISKQLLKQLAVLSRLYDKDHEMFGPIHRELYAQGIVATIRRLRGSDRAEESTALVKELDSLLRRYPDEEILGIIQRGLDVSQNLPDTIG
jgi:hypothetical protein